MKVKVFSGTPDATEASVNAWLAEHPGDDIAIVNMFVTTVANGNTPYHFITYIYRELVTPAKDDQPAVYQ